MGKKRATEMKDYRVLFAPSFKETTGEEGKTVLDTAHEAGVYLDSQCNGKGKCGKCRIRVMEGTVSPFISEESEFIKPRDRGFGYRLACMTRIAGDVTVLIPGENVLKSEVKKKVFSKRSNVLNPAVKSYCLDLSGKRGTGHAYFEGITRLLIAQCGLKDLTIDLTVLQNISKAVKEGGGRVTVLVWMDREIIDVRSGWDKTCLGLALDVGTTTVALYLCDLKNGNIIASGSITNPQVLFGADIMSRISYSANHPGKGVQKMQKELISSVNTLIDQMAVSNGFSPHQIVDMTVVGNTVMHHIFLGIAPDHLGLWPFTPSIQGSLDIKVRELGILINPSSYVHVLSVEAGFVGADNVGVLLSEEPYNKDGLSLIMDLGTNGELVLGNRETLLSCSCATGPALEGTHISSGMRAMKGAIEKIRIDPENFEVDYAVVGKEGWAREHPPGDLKPVGICGSAIIDTVAYLFRTGVMGKDGAFSENINTQRLRKGSSGVMEFVLVWGHETATGNDIVLTQLDVRQIQLAKAALHGGCKVLMGHLKINSVNRIIVAGAFGMHIDKENALTIGLFPWCDPVNITMVGNAAGHGAYLTLINREKRAEADRIAGMVTHIELALEDGFQREFMNALSIPYGS
jgi:uncharacterized 2Fe-2S/4Fe-4S cluster protein (DUF4445 family)